MAASRRRRELPEVEGVIVERGVGPAREETETSSAPLASVKALPDPYESTAEGELDAKEREHLMVCEAAIDVLRRAFGPAGQALQVIRDARLYRETHPNFEAYCTERWDMSRTQADRLIRAWPYDKLLAPIGANVTESQVRELIPVGERHGEEAAVTVYRTVAEADGVRVTAAVLKGAVSVLPEDHFEPDVAVARIRDHLAGKLNPDDPSPALPSVMFAAEVKRVRALLRRTASAPRDERKRFASELRALADELEQ